MKNRSFIFFVLIVAGIFGVTYVNAGNHTVTVQESADGKYSYTEVEDDPLGVRIYTLDNGLTVYTTVNKDEPRIQTMVSVRAGSKQDPPNNTGLAHYLEHMLFKGTDSMGTMNYEKEKVYLDIIEELYEEYNQTTDPDKRLEIYRKIDSVSYLAAEYAIPNEFDMLMRGLGASGINAFTSTEQTAYICEIPSNQLENWARVEAERYRNPVMRLFHLELEVVYEEKNRSLDNDGRKVFDAMLAGLFQNHTYGTQTTLGSVEHLRNPSIRAIREYYDKYYQPNNMAVILSGDFDPDEAVKIIDKHFSYMEPAVIPQFTFDPEESSDEPIEKTVLGPEAESLSIGFRLPGIGYERSLILTVISDLLSNGEAGLIDLNLNQQQKTQSAGSWTWMQEDYSLLNLNGRPREGQSLEEVRDLLLEQLELLRNGDFEEEMLEAIINNLRADRMRQYESNSFRSRVLAGSFVLGLPWEEYLQQPDLMADITKDDIVAFANDYLGNDYVVVYKKEGEDPEIDKVDQPPITPIVTEREERSDFFKSVMANTPDPIEPAFLNFEEDIAQFNAGNLPVYYIRNEENDLFRMYYMLDMGSRHDLELALAVQYLEFVGTEEHTPEEISKAFYRLAGRYGISVSDDQMYVYVRGLESNFDETIKLFHDLLSNAVVDTDAYDNLVSRILRNRRDNKQSRGVILQRAMFNYAVYGEDNPFMHRLSEEELYQIDPEMLIEKLHGLLNYEHRVFYYGPSTPESITASLKAYHPMPETYQSYPEPVTFERREMDHTRIYFVDFDMVQAEILWVSKDDLFDPSKLAVANLYNQYFGIGMSSLVFQRIREARALAYATYSIYRTPSKKEDPHYIISYVGTQHDKMTEAINAMHELKADLPMSESRLENARMALDNNLRSSRTTRHNILFAYNNALKLGLDYDISQMLFETAPAISLDDIREFYQRHYTDRHYFICVLGDAELLNPEETLSEFGEVKVLELEEIFGY
jgi:predicted Zn-dependent peptidase